MNNDRLATYLKSLESPERPFLEQVEREALESYVPIIRKEIQSFLKVILEITRPMRILEVGTAVGFSALLMSEYIPGRTIRPDFYGCSKRTVSALSAGGLKASGAGRGTDV